jgi:purine nucleosidase
VGIRRVLIDTDMGCDDVIAICMMLLANELSIEGISVVDGVAHLERGVKNILRVLTAANRIDIPVIAGAAAPLFGNAVFPEADRIEADNLPFLQDLLPPQVQGIPLPMSAAEFIYSKVVEHSGEITLVCLGPLTNVAITVEKYGEQFTKSLKQMIIMGGAVYAPGNVPLQSNPQIKVAEYNMYIDPRAAERVLHSGAKIMLIGMDVTRLVPIELCRERVRGIIPAQPAARVILATIKNATTMAYLYDPLAAGVVIDPSIITETKGLSLSVITDADDERVGQTIPMGPGLIEVVLNVNVPKFYALLLGLLQR